MTKLVEDPYTQYLTFVISIMMVSIVGTLANYLTTLDEKIALHLQRSKPKITHHVKL